MKKLIFCCLIIFMGSCKDKGKEVEPDKDYSAGFVGEYWTTTSFDTYGTDQNWKVERLGSNLLGMNYTFITAISVPEPVKITRTYKLKNITIEDENTFLISEDAEVETNGVSSIENVQGTGVKVTDASGATKIGITLKFTPAAGAARTTEYLEFKKK